MSNVAVFVDETRDEGYGLHTLFGAFFISAVGTGGTLDYAVNVNIVLNVKK